MKNAYTALLSLIILTGTLWAQDYAYVMNGIAETLSRINLETGEVENHIVTLGAVPNQVLSYNNLLYVVNSSSPSLMVIDPVSNTVTAEIAMPTNSNPWNVSVYNNQAFVTGFVSNSVYVVDLSQNVITDTWEVGQTPEGILATEDRLYVANVNYNPDDYSYGQGSISILDIDDGSLLGEVNAGTNPQNIIMGTDGLLNIICTGNYWSVMGMVYFIDTISMQVIDSLELGGTPLVAAISNSGIVYVAGGGWSSDGYVYAYDAVNHTVIWDANDPVLVDKGAAAAAVDNYGTIYVACSSENTVNTISADGEITGSYNVGSGPYSLAILDSRTGIENETAPTPSTIELAMAYPNPFNSSVNIVVNGVLANDSKIEIYDITGRLVNKLSLTDFESINHKVTWTGLDFSGTGVASGVYFARLAGASGSVKMVLLR